MVLKIVQAGHPVLRREARALSAADLRSAAVRDLVDHMRDTMRDAPGVGLAAPQIGEPLQLAVIEDRVEYTEAAPDALLAERGRRPVPFHVIANPRLTLGDGAPAEFFEGCLSLDGFSAVVARARTVHVDALDEDGRPISIDADGWYARILQHEIDHLHGTLYIDRMEPRTFAGEACHARYLAGVPVDELLAAVGRTSRWKGR